MVSPTTAVVLAVVAYWVGPILPLLRKPTNFPSRELILDSGIQANASDRCLKLFDPAAPAASGMPMYCEDLAVWEEKGVAILSCDPGRGKWNTVMGPLEDPAPRGSLYAYDFHNVAQGSRPTAKQLYPLKLTGLPADATFHPLGIDVHADSKGVTLFVINHRAERSVIELFDLSQSASGAVALKWRQTATHPKIYTPNSMAVLSHDSVLFTNDHYFSRRKGLIRQPFVYFETLLGFPLGSVEQLRISSDGTADVQTVARGITFANGIAISPDRKTITVASCGVGNRFFTYDLVDADGPDGVVTLRHRQTVKVPFAPDNIRWPTAPLDSPFYITGHPHALSLVEVAKQPRAPRDHLVAGIHVDEVRLDAQGKAHVKTVLRDDGRWYGTGSTAVKVADGRLIVTGLYEKGFLDCSTA